MKIFLAIMLVCVSAVGQKMHVKVVTHSVGGVPFTRYVPGIGLSNGNASANCSAYGNTANCNSTATGTAIYAPAHTIQGSLTDIYMMLLLPDGRRVEVACDDHFGTFAQSHLHRCKNPDADEMEADFSGDKVKLTWGVGIDEKKKESETFRVGHVYQPLPVVKP